MVKLEVRVVAAKRCDYPSMLRKWYYARLCGRGAWFWRCFPQGVWSSSVHSNKRQARQCILTAGVAPIKKVSLPRLELSAAVVNARSLKFVIRALPMKVARVVCWSDSMVTLHWIKGQSSSCKPFVANRVAEIQSTWDPECWRYCASKENPADLLTRGLSCSDMISSTLWWNGRQWMSSPCEPLPAQPENEACEEIKIPMCIQQSLQNH